ncbi:MAG: hypothetical protein K6G51_03215 [Sphaerochaetaceae bacterium]|nr:hypothetical protein [Sphaerochaetaceae bacterium]
MKKVLLYCSVVLFLLTSCVHHSPYKEEYFFQAMGEDSEIVITADATRLKEGGYLVGFNDPLLLELLDRSERVNVALTTDTEEYPAKFSDYTYYGGLEGNFGPFIINNALYYSKDFKEIESDGISYYQSKSLEAEVPRGGLLLFSRENYPSIYKKTYSDRVIYIDDVTAERLGDSVVGIYIRKPQTMFDLGFDIPQSVFLKMEEAIVYIIEDGENLSLNADVTMESESNAKTLITLIRNKELFNLKKSGIKPDFKELSNKYYYDGNIAMVRNHNISKGDLIKLINTVSNKEE